MKRGIRMFVLLAAAVAAGGCATVPEPTTTRAQAPMGAAEPARSDARNHGDDKEKHGDDKKDEPKKPPKTLLEWAIGPEEKKKDDDEPDRIVTDRPDFTEASSTVGLGRVQLEAGYTYTRDRTVGSRRITQTLPEALLRVGAFADWFELRLGQNFTHSQAAFGPPTEHLAGLDDLYVGTKLGLAEQKGHLPEMALILQATLPTGARGISAERLLPGFNLLYGWDVVENLIDAGGSLQANRAIDAEGHPYVELAQSVTAGYWFT